MFTKQVIRHALRTCKPHSTISKSYPIGVCQPCIKYQALLLVHQRNVHFCSALLGKTFHDTENKFFFHVLDATTLDDNMPAKAELRITDDAKFTSYLSRDWRNSSVTEIVEAFKTVESFCTGHNVSVSDPRFDGLVNGLMDQCEKLTDGELLELLHSLSEYPGCGAYSSHNYHDIWSCLDDICCWKMSNWDIDTLFVFGDAWFKLKLGKVSDFIYELLNRLVKKADTLTKDQLVRIFFYFNVCRKRPVDFNYECALESKIKEMNVDELAVVALGFFKTQSRIKLSPIMEAMVTEVTSNAMGIHEISLTGIMKVLRFSNPVKVLPNIKKMLDSLHPELDRFSDLCCLHVALLATGVQTFHGNILRKCSQKLVENIANTRLKDIERILNVLTMFTYDPKTKPDIFAAALQELLKDSRADEINNFPRCLASALHYLSMRNIYSYKLMDRVLEHEFITANFGKQAKMLPRQLFCLDACIDVDCPDYTGKRLPSVLRYKAAKWQTDWMPSHDQWKKVSAKDKLFLDTTEAVTKIVGQAEFVMLQHVLPHFPMADIIICKDTKTGSFMKPTGFDQYVLGDIMRPFNDGTLKWYAILVLIWNNTARETNAPLGQIAMKLRQLKKIGYNPVIVIWNEFMPLSPEEKQQYILKKLV